MDIKAKLINFNIESKFDYEATTLNSKVVAIFNQDFESLEQANNQRCWIVLDTTCIYALSGGEEPDKGYIESNNQKYEILDAIKAPNGQHLHLIQPTFAIRVGDVVKVVCDANAKQIISANHTAEHLVQGTLQKLIDPELKQMGVNLTHNGCSVSFEHKTKLTVEQLKEIEDYVNNLINKHIDVEVSYKTLEEARTSGVRAKFDAVYSKVKGLLRVVKIGDIYNVLCAGRHVKNTSELEQFHIVRFSSKGSNVWKIDGIATKQLINEYISKMNNEIISKINVIKKQINDAKFDDQNFIQKLDKIVISQEWNETISNVKKLNDLSIDFNKVFEIFRNKELDKLIVEIVESTYVDNSKPYHLIQLQNQPSNILNRLGTLLIQKHPTTGFVILNVMADKIAYALIKNQLANILKPNELIKQINSIVEGRGGGKENQCQGSCPYLQENVNKIKVLIDNLK